MSTAKLLRWSQEHRVPLEEEWTTLQPRGDQDPPSTDESQNTQVWFKPADWKTQRNQPVLLHGRSKVKVSVIKHLHSKKTTI